MRRLRCICFFHIPSCNSSEPILLLQPQPQLKGAVEFVSVDYFEDPVRGEVEDGERDVCV